MALWTKKADEKPAGATGNGHPVSSIRPAEAAAPSGNGRVGIDHAIQLMRSLPTDKNVELVVTVLKTTLESLGIRVADIVKDAAQRQQEIETRVAQFKGEIAALEKEIDQRVQEIARLEAAHAETTKVRDYLEGDEIEVVPDDARPTTVA